MNTTDNNTRTHKNITYRIRKDSFGYISHVVVFWAGTQYDFPTIKRAKAFIEDLV